jgi:hypothetical protein
MMARLVVFMVAALVTACTAAPPERQAVEEAADALGGVARIQALKALTIDATGTAECGSEPDAR